MLANIVTKNLEQIRKDMQEITTLTAVKGIDFFDVFPTSEQHRTVLDKELNQTADLIKATDRGNIYRLRDPLKTIFGDLEYIKIRIYDESRLNWSGAADFNVKSRQPLMQQIGKDARFSYIERPDWDAIEFKTRDTLIYFLEPLASKVYGGLL